MVAEMQKQQVVTGKTFFLDPRVKCARAQEFEEKLAARIIGQESAVRRMSGLYQLFLRQELETETGRNLPGKGVGRLMLGVMNREKKKTHQEEIARAAKAKPEVQRSTQATRSESVMKSAVRVVKRGRDESLKSLQVDDKGGTATPCEREIASTVRNWIAEREQRRSLSERRNWDILIKFAQ